MDYGALTKAKITAFQELGGSALGVRRWADGGDLRLHTEVTDVKKVGILLQSCFCMLQSFQKPRSL